MLNRARIGSVVTLVAGFLAWAPMAVANEGNDTEKTQRFSLERAAPANALAVIGVSDFPAMLGGLKQSAIANLLKEDEVRQFLAPMFENLDTWVAEARREIRREADEIERFVDSATIDRLVDPREWMEILEGLGGEVLVVLADVREVEGEREPVPDLLIGVDLGQWGSTVQRWLDEKLPELRRFAEEEAEHEGRTLDLPEFGTYELAGVQVHTISHKELEEVGGRLHYAFMGDYLLFGMFADTFEAAVKRGNLAKGTLLDNERYRYLSNRLDRRPGSLFAYADVERILARSRSARSDREEQELKALGFDGVKAIGASFSPVEGGARWRVYAHAPTPRRGALALISQPSRTLSAPSMAPAGASFLVSLGADPKSIFDQVMAMVREFDGEDSYQEALRDIDAAQEEIGFHPVNDLLASLGDEISFFGTLPKTGFIPDVALVVNLRDSGKFNQILSALTDRVQEEAPQVSITTLQYKGRTLYSLTADDWELPVPLAFTIDQNRLLVSLGMQSLKKIVNGNSAGTLADDPQFRQAASQLGFRPNDPATFLYYIDAKALFEWGYNTAVPMLGSQVPPELGLDMALLPMTETLSQHIRNPMSIYRVDDQGLTIDMLSIF